MPTEETMSEQTQEADSASVESRLANFFAPEAAPEEQPQAEAQQPQEAAAPEAVETEQPQEAAPETEGEAFEVDGVEYRLPSDLKAKVAEWREGHLRREDYTQKTQQLAELTRQAAAINEAFQVQKQFDDQIAPKRDELARVKHQLSQFKAVNWADLDVQQHLSLRSQMEQLKDTANELEGQIKAEQSKFAESTVSKKRELLETGHRYLASAIKGWNEQTQESAISAARSVGFTDNEIGSVIDPRFVHMAWKAAQFDKLQSGKPAAVAAVQKAPPVVKPGASLGTGVAAESKYRDARSSLKKSGSLKDAARLFMLKG
jgi:small-conductance mechanosensitive channel